MRTVKSKEKPTIDKRSLTSAINGLKGGRPSYLHSRLNVCITAKDSKQAILADDNVLGLELALKRLLPNVPVMVQSYARLKKQNINVLNQRRTEFIYINGYQIPYPKDIDNYFNHFLPLTKGTQDFKFIMRVPKEACTK